MPAGFEKYKTYISRLGKGEAEVQLSTFSSPTCLRHFGCRRHLFAAKTIKNYEFIAQLTIFFILSHYRNRRYGNEYYDKTYSYEIF